MKQTNVTLTASEVIDIVNDSPASMFTKSDVIALIKSIKENDTTAIQFTDEMVGQLLEHVRHEMYVNIDDEQLVDCDSAKFEIEDGNTIVLAEIDCDTDHAIDVAEEAIREWFDRNVL